MLQSRNPVRFVLALCRTMIVLLLCIGVLLPVTGVYAANVNITWNTSVSSTPIPISTGDSITWNGSLSSHPLRETDVSFGTDGTILANTGMSYVQTFNTPGTYYFKCGVHGFMHTTIVVTAVCAPPATSAPLDIDGNGTIDAMTDGLLVVRYLLGLRNAALTTGAMGLCPSPARTEAIDIKNYLDTLIIVPTP